MGHKEHIVNILKEVNRGGPNPGEGMTAYLNRMAESILSYIPVTQEAEKKATKKA